MEVHLLLGLGVHEPHFHSSNDLSSVHRLSRPVFNVSNLDSNEIEYIPLFFSFRGVLQQHRAWADGLYYTLFCQICQLPPLRGIIIIMKTENIHFNQVILVSGPVIIKDGKVLLNKHGESNLWKFPGGDITEASGDLESWAAKKAKEELGIDVKIIKALRPMIIWKDDETIVLFHYLAGLISDEIKPAAYIREWAWLDIENLPEDCSENVKKIIEDIKQDKLTI